MSLNWDATKAEHWEDLDWDKKESLIFATMAVDMGEITEKNYEEFFKRYVMFCDATGQTRYLTLADVKSAIGLHTNVSTSTPAAYKKRLYGIIERHADDVVWYEKREAEKEEAS